MTLKNKKNVCLCCVCFRCLWLLGRFLGRFLFASFSLFSRKKARKKTKKKRPKKRRFAFFAALSLFGRFLGRFLFAFFRLFSQKKSEKKRPKSDVLPFSPHYRFLVAFWVAFFRFFPRKEANKKRIKSDPKSDNAAKKAKQKRNNCIPFSEPMIFAFSVSCFSHFIKNRFGFFSENKSCSQNLRSSSKPHHKHIHRGFPKIGVPFWGVRLRGFHFVFGE